MIGKNGFFVVTFTSDGIFNGSFLRDFSSQAPRNDMTSKQLLVPKLQFGNQAYFADRRSSPASLQSSVHLDDDLSIIVDYLIQLEADHRQRTARFA
jgi:hypothetical protein